VTRPTAPLALDELALHRAARSLARRDPALRAVLRTYGPPPLWAREPGFATLVHMILEQQVSLASALAAFMNLKRACRGVVTPRKLLRFDDVEMKRIGFSWQKAGYARELARAILDRRFDPHALEHLDDDAVRQALVALKGIGPWTADVYLLMVLLRPDAWPLWPACSADLCGTERTRRELAAASRYRSTTALAFLPEPSRPIWLSLRTDWECRNSYVNR
jgi:DNA-3-methyladenine glycosylase II